MMTDKPRRGWREKIEPGINRAHRVACPSTLDKRPARRCSCPYEIQVPGYHPATSRTVTVAGTLTDARNQRRAFLAAGRPASPHPIDPDTLDDFARHYLRTVAPRQAPSSIKTTSDGYRLRVSPSLGDLRLEDLTRQRLELWLADLVEQGATRDMTHKAIKALRVILAKAVEWGRLPENPARRLKLPTPASGTKPAAKRVLTEQQLAVLIEKGATSLRVETMIRAASEAGLRKGEVIGLRWTDLDLSERRLDVQRSVWQERGQDGAPPRRIVKAPKSGHPRRIAISQALARRLGEWYADSVIGRGADATGYVWPGRDGGPMDDGTPTQALERALKRAGLSTEGAPPPVTFHGLRHTAASIILSHGVPITIVARQLGHANPNITATIYAHLLEEAHLDRAAAVFDQASDAQTMGETMGEHDRDTEKPATKPT